MKTLAVLGYFDEKSLERIGEIREHVIKGDENLCDSANLPHLTFTISEDTNREELEKQIAELVARRQLPEVNFSHMGFFPKKKIIFLGVTPSISLLLFHRQIVRIVTETGAGLFPYSVPSKWVPHCSIKEDSESIDIVGDIFEDPAFAITAKITKLSITEMDQKSGELVYRIDFSQDEMKGF